MAVDLNTPRTPKLRAPLTFDTLDQLAHDFRDVGADHIADHIAEAVDRLDTIRDDLADTIADGDRRRAALVDQLTNGKARPSTVAGKLAELPDPDQLRQVTSNATGSIRRTISQWLHDQGDDLLAPLHQAVTDAAHQVTKYHPLIEGVPTDPALHFAPPDVADAWRNVHDATQRIEACWQLAKLLRGRLELVPDFPPPAVPDPFWRWHRPEILDDHPADAYSHPHHWWAAVIAAGAKPAVLTAEQVAELHIVST